MELTPSHISGATFRTVRRGYDPAEVDALLRNAATALERAQQHATAMEARARAAVARLQETSAAVSAESAPSGGGAVRLTADDAESISRTLLLAQNTADRAIAEAEAEAQRIIDAARAEADATLDSTREMSSQIIDEARVEARKTTDTERMAAAEEVDSLKARREFLLGDVDQLEAFLVDQRERLRMAARQIEEICERVPDGLGTVNPPPVSASDDVGGETGELLVPPQARMPFADASTLAYVLPDDHDLALDAGTDGSSIPQPVLPDDLDAIRLPVRGAAPGETDAGDDGDGADAADGDAADGDEADGGGADDGWFDLVPDGSGQSGRQEDTDPFAVPGELGDGDAADVDTGELDITKAMDRLEQERPMHGNSPPK